ncbi:hypothetical protein WJX72_009274 [[Myrmecia] bisecta]|uniref:Uncharacterized protein n=1 Tax=[Myrmecia] bisecta TaxID=41462 RepID=A0AAW1R7Q8_9CHLO
MGAPHRHKQPYRNTWVPCLTCEHNPSTNPISFNRSQIQLPFPPDQQAALIVALSDLLALPTDAISVISYSMRTLTFRRQLQQTSSAVDVTVELQCGTVERLGPISNMLSRVTSDGTLAANLDSRGMPLSKLLLMSTITVAPNQVSSICRLNASRQCIDSSAIGSRNQIMIAVIVPLAAIVAITMLIIYVMYRRRKTEEQIRAEEKVRPSTSNSIQIREPVVIGKSDKGKGKVFDYPMEPAVKGKWKWKDDRIVEEYHNTTGRYNFARTDSRKTVSTESLGMGSSSKDKTAEPKQGWFAKFRRGRVSKKKLNPAATASPSKSASFAKKAAAAAAAGTAGSAAAVTADSSSIKAVPGVMHIPLEQHSGNSMCSMASGGSTTYSNPAFQNSTALTHRTSRLDDLE